jgi:hypothetical protein
MITAMFAETPDSFQHSTQPKSENRNFTLVSSWKNLRTWTNFINVFNYCFILVRMIIAVFSLTKILINYRFNNYHHLT